MSEQLSSPAEVRSEQEWREQEWQEQGWREMEWHQDTRYKNTLFLNTVRTKLQNKLELQNYNSTHIGNNMEWHLCI